MIADILFMNQKQSIADLETQTRSQNLNPNLEPRTLNRINYRFKKPETEPKPRTQTLNQSIADRRNQISDLSIWS